MKKKALLSSVLTIALCLSLIAGSTFALFTSESSVNIAVTAGRVDVQATIEEIAVHSPTSISVNGNVIDDTEAATGNTFKNGGTALFEGGNTLTLDKVTPGDRVTATIKLTNNSNVAIQYRTIIKGGEGDNELLSGLKVTFGEGEDAQSFTGDTIKSAWAVYEGNDPKTIRVTIELPATAGNEYQEKSCNLIFTVEAVQGNAEMPNEWDGSSVEAPEQDVTGVYHITNAAEFMALMNSFNDGVVNTWRGEYAESQIVLDCNIDLGGAIIERGIPSFFYGKFDGQGHVISNFTLKRVQGANDPDDSGFTGYYTSLFDSLDGSTSYVKNLTIENATVIGNKSVSAIVGTIWDGTVDNCHVINSTLIGIDQVGAVVGYNGANGTVSNCSATDCNIFYSRTSGLNEDLGGDTCGVIGDNDGTATGCTASNTAPEFKAIGYVLTTAEEFRAYITGLNNNPQSDAAHRYDSANVVLTNDIDLGGATITASGEGYMFSGSFDGLGHTVSNYTIKRTDGQYYTGLFSVYMQDATIKNLTVENGTVISNGKQVAAIVPSVYGNATVENCHAVNCIVSGDKKVGAVAGYAQTGGTVKNCSAKGCSVYASNNDAIDANLFGYNNGGTFANNTDKGGNTLSYGTAYTFVTNATDLSSAMHKGGNILLLNDISVDSWTPVRVDTANAYQPIANSISIDGNGHSISGLTSSLLGFNPAQYVEIKNLTIKNSNIVSNEAGNNANCGAFAAYVDGGVFSFKMSNCHAVNVNVTANNSGAYGAAALIGYEGITSADGVFSIVDCTVTGGSVTNSYGNAAAIVGMCYTNANSAVISGCTVSGVTITGQATEKQGAIAGTICNGGGSLEIANCTYTGNTYGRLGDSTVNVNVH